uniref:Uncharacterized protein n=1 Tax=Gossypium raimondii TaxID=29730 RepID=A0A0D2MBQ5_GOSRA|nr:hypothetical protein B456_002G160200 [Gossypium raimondii]
MSPNQHYQCKNLKHFKYSNYPNRQRCSGKPMMGLRGHHFQSSQFSHMAISNHMQYCSLLPPQIQQAALSAKPRLHLLTLVRSFSFTTLVDGLCIYTLFPITYQVYTNSHEQ